MLCPLSTTLQNGLNVIRQLKLHHTSSGFFPSSSQSHFLQFHVSRLSEVAARFTELQRGLCAPSSIPPSCTVLPYFLYVLRTYILYNLMLDPQLLQIDSVLTSMWICSRTAILRTYLTLTFRCSCIRPEKSPSHIRTCPIPAVTKCTTVKPLGFEGGSIKSG